MDTQDTIQELFALSVDDQLHTAQVDKFSAVHNCIIGAVIARNFGFIDRCLKSIFALGVQVGREDVKLDIYRDALEDSEQSTEGE